MAESTGNSGLLAVRLVSPERLLLDATADDPIGVLSVFSSVAARYGNRGQSAYAMANEVLNRVAQAEAQRRGDACIVRSMNWGPWEGGMVTPALAKHFAEMNVPLIGLAAGARAFVQELLGPGSHVEVVIGGPVLDRARLQGARDAGALLRGLQAGGGSLQAG